MKRIFSVFLAVMIAAAALCWNGISAKAADAKRLSVVTTIFPEYDWVRQILGDKFSDADVTMLLDNGVDLHSYQPTVDDMVKIANCDLFIYVGGESDGWVEDALKNAVNKDMKVINLLEVLGDSVKEEETVEGMQEEEHDHEDADEHEDAEEHEHEEKAEYDEHVWLSLRNAETLCKAISDALQQIASDNKDAYAANTAAYVERLAALDTDYQATVDAATYQTVRKRSTTTRL